MNTVSDNPERSIAYALTLDFNYQYKAVERSVHNGLGCPND